MAKIGDKFLASIAPTDDSVPPKSGPVTDVSFSIEGDAYTAEVAADGVSVILTAVKAGTASITCEAKNVLGDALKETVSLDAVVVDTPVVTTKLNLSVVPA